MKDRAEFRCWLPVELHRAMKAKAALEGKTLQAYFEEVVQRVVEFGKDSAAK